MFDVVFLTLTDASILSGHRMQKTCQCACTWQR